MQGMKRLGAEEAPEMFPATTDRLAEAVEGDDAAAAVIRPLMAGTRLEKVPMRSVLALLMMLLPNNFQHLISCRILTYKPSIED